MPSAPKAHLSELPCAVASVPVPARSRGGAGIAGQLVQHRTAAAPAGPGALRALLRGQQVSWHASAERFVGNGHGDLLSERTYWFFRYSVKGACHLSIFK